MQEDLRIPRGTGDGLPMREREGAILVLLNACESSPRSPSWLELSPGQRACLATLHFERKLAEGGLESYFFSSNGDWDRAVREALQLMGAYVAMGFFDRAAGAFPGGALPEEPEDREELMGLTTADMMNTLADLERRFKERGEGAEDLCDLRLRYIDSHAHEFFRD